MIHPHPESAICPNRQRLNTAKSLMGLQRSRSVHLGCSRPPSNKSCRASCPEIPRRVLDQGRSVEHVDSVLASVATNFCVYHLAQRMCMVVCTLTFDPDFSLSIFEDSRNEPPTVLLVQNKPVVDEVSQTGTRSDPKASVSCAHQGKDGGRGQRFSGPWDTRNKTHAIKFKEPRV